MRHNKGPEGKACRIPFINTLPLKGLLKGSGLRVKAFVTIRLIILGSLAGRLFGYAEDHTICDSPQNLTEALQYAEYLHEDLSSYISKNATFNTTEIKRACLRCCSDYENRTVAIGKPERQVRKASHCSSKQQSTSCTAITVLLLVRTTYIWVLFFAHIPFVLNLTFNATTERVAYHGAMSPLHAWAITLLSAIIPWLCLVPWTPFEIGQHFISCSNEKYPWPCLTFYMSCFLRAVMRLALEVASFIFVIALYHMYIPQTVMCRNDTVMCVLLEHQEMTCFLWLLTAINLVSACLTLYEIYYMHKHSELYRRDHLDDFLSRQRSGNSLTQSIKFDGESSRCETKWKPWHGTWSKMSCKGSRKKHNRSSRKNTPHSPIKESTDEVFLEEPQ